MKERTFRRLEELEQDQEIAQEPACVWIGTEDSPKPDGWAEAKNRLRIIHEVIDPEWDSEL
jgi:hypothetical protein